jgi:hypothetical protein
MLSNTVKAVAYEAETFADAAEAVPGQGWANAFSKL